MTALWALLAPDLGEDNEKNTKNWIRKNYQWWNSIKKPFYTFFLGVQSRLENSIDCISSTSKSFWV